jgi:hypothetical protein
MCISSLIVGIRIGKSLSDGKVPTVNINPVKTIARAVEQHKDKKALEEEMTDIFSTSRDTILDAMRKG